MKIDVIIPVLHTCDELRKMTTDCINSINIPHNWSLKVINGSQSLSEKWNVGVYSTADVVFIINNDIIHREDTFINMLEAIKNNPQYVAWSSDQVKMLNSLEWWQPTHAFSDEWFNWSWFAIKPLEWQAYNLEFDEKIGQGAYQDVDMKMQIESKGLSIARYLGACVYHASDTSRKYNAVQDWEAINSKNREYVKIKWNIQNI